MAAIAAFRGEEAGFVAGISWLPGHALEALVFGTGAEGPVESLETVVRALELDFAFVPAEAPWAAEAVEALHSAGAAAVWAVPGVLGRLGERLGWTEALRLTVSEPGALASALAEVLHDALESARAGLRASADAVLVADELAGASGPLVSPDFALDALVPCYRAIAADVAAGDVPAIFHSDGDIRALMPALKRAGFSAVHLGGVGADGFAASLSAARAAGLVMVGGIEAASLLAGARHDGARAGNAAASGGLVVCDDGGLTLAEEVAAYATAVEAARAAFGEGAGPAE